jgi:hypothetical protein
MPTFELPVKLRCRTNLFVHSSSPMAGVFAKDEVTTLKTPGGYPVARSKSFASAIAHSGVSGAGLQMTVLPVDIAAPTLRVIMAIGLFHGVIAATPCISTFFNLRATKRTDPLRLANRKDAVVIPRRGNRLPAHKLNESLEPL